MSNDVWIINGIPGAGKSTTAKALAKHFKQSVHIEGDVIQDMIISGNVSPGQEPPDEESRQIHLNILNQCMLAHSFSEAGFTPIIDYIIVNKSRIEEYQKHLNGFTLYLVTLSPGIETALERDMSRPEKTVAHLWTHLENEIKSGVKDYGYWIDNKLISVDKTVEEILMNKKLARILSGR